MLSVKEDIVVEKATIFEIKRFAVHDGDGIRTTVFFKGCPLKCVWCHNPEGINIQSELAYYSDKCINCGECVAVCPSFAHTIDCNGHTFDREKCISCGKCVDSCLGDALQWYGKKYSVSELLDIVLSDREFYENSNGGVTLSGGECLLQADFCAEFLKALKKENINTAVDTSGFVSKKAFEKVIPYTDKFLFDIKAFDDDVHINCTGQSNKIILENLKYINSMKKSIEIRIPYVPKFNDNQIEKIGDFIIDLKSAIEVKILPYHNYAKSKYLSLNIKNTIPEYLPSREEIIAAENHIRKKNIIIKD